VHVRRSPALLLVWCLVGCEEGSLSDVPSTQPYPPPIDVGDAGVRESPGSLDAPFGSLGGTISGGFAGFGGMRPPAFVDPDAGPPVRLRELRTAAKTPPPISGGTLAVDKAGTMAVAADSDRDLVYIVNLSEGGVRKVKLASGSEPGRVALEGSSAAHIALRGTGKLVRIDLATASVALETAVCAHPRGVAFDGAHAQVAVTCLDGQLILLEATSHREAARRSDLPTDLRDIIIGASGVEAVTRYRNAELVRLNPDRSVKSSARPRNGQRFSKVPFPPFVSDGGVPFPQTMSPGLASLSPTLAWRTLRGASGNTWMLHQQSQNEQVIISQGGYGSGGCSTITGGKVSELDADGNTLRSMGVALLGLSVDAALSPNEKWLALASPGGYARSAGTLRVYATNAMLTVELAEHCQESSHAGGDENQTVAVAFDDNNVLYSFSREPAELQIFAEPAVAGISDNFAGGGARLSRKASIALDLSSVRDTGHDLFHADVGGGLACASCHGEAQDDGHVWDFEVIGPRRTQNMRGGLLATAPFHWDGDMMSINHLVDEVMSRRMGGFPVATTFAAALGGWIDRQPALILPAVDTDSVARGKALFVAAGPACSTCHSGKSFTNNESKDVGTGGKFQVPSLLGLALRAPYMHSGCAKTLEGRFVAPCGGGDSHGVTSKLSATQIADLVAYLKTL
jgi:mono/diheme cytochrome c family protein